MQQVGVHPKDRGADNPRLQCPHCAKWKRHMSVRQGEYGQHAHYNFYNLSEQDSERLGYQELCSKCWNELGLLPKMEI
jgi:hypothetical protein